MLEFLSQPVFQRIALTLLHFLWQGAAVAAGLWLVLRILNRRGAAVRYAACVAGMGTIIALPAMTFFAVKPAVSPDTAVIGNSREQTGPNRPVQQFEPQGNAEDAGDQVSLQASPANEIDAAGQAESVPPFAVAITPYLVTGWMLGVLAFALRLLCGFAGTKRLLRDRVDLSGTILAMARDVAVSLRMRAAPLVCGSRRVAEAMAVGFFRPVILLPISWLADVPVDVLRSVLAHELAHVRRWDRWVNLLQRIVEAVLFYHPAVWWISGRMRTEREFCCDEEAAAAVGGAIQYAEALEHIGRLHWNQRQLLLTNPIGGTKMALLKRVRRVLGQSESNSRRDGWTVGLLALCIPLMLLVASAWWPSGPSSASAAVLDDGDRDRKQGDRERGDRKPEDREKGDREKGDRERGERPDPAAAQRRGEERDVRKVIVRKERPDRREGDRDDRRGEDRKVRVERRDGERGDRRGEERKVRIKRRDGDRPGAREPGRRDDPKPRERGDRPAGGDRFRKDDRRRDVERERDARRRDVERERDAARRRVGDRVEPASMRQLLAIVRDLQAEVRQLRKEVQELKGRRGDRPMGDRGPRTAPRREGDRPRGDGLPGRPGGEPRREGDRKPTAQ